MAACWDCKNWLGFTPESTDAVPMGRCSKIQDGKVDMLPSLEAEVTFSECFEEKEEK